MAGLTQATPTSGRDDRAGRTRLDTQPAGTRDARHPDGRRWTHERTAADGRRPRPRPVHDTGAPRAVITDGLPSQLPDIDPDETQEWLDSLDAVVGHAGRDRARYLMLRLLERSREQQVGVPVAAQHRLHQHHPAAAGAVVPRRRARRAPDPRLHPLERRDHGAPRAAARDRRRRAHLLLRVVRVAVRGRLQPLLPRQGPPRRRRPDLVPGPRLPRHLRPRLPRGPARPRTSSTGSARRSATPAAGCRPTRTRG